MRYSKGEFSAGELSPAIYGRPEYPEFSAGAKVLKNMLPLPLGGATNRPGTQFIAEAMSAGTAWRLVSFVFSDGDAFVLEFTHLRIQFYKDRAQVGAPYQVTTPWGHTKISALRFAQSADTLFIFHPDHQPQTLVRTTDTNWTLAAFDYVNGPYLAENSTATTITPSAATGTITLTASAAIFDADGIYASERTLWQIKHWIEAQSVTQSFSGVGQSSSIKCGGTWRLVTHGTWAGTVEIEVSEDNSTWTATRILISTSDKNWDTYTTEAFAAQFYVRVNVTAYSVGPVQVDLSTDPFEWVGVARITNAPAGGSGAGLVMTADATVLETLGGTAATKIWAEGAWSGYRGFPTCGTFYQDRLCLAGSAYNPDTIWMSKSGNYYNFATSFPIQDDDGISVRLPSRELNKIRNLIPSNSMVAHTSSGLFTVGPGESGLLTPTSILIKANDLAGSSDIPPVLINDRIVYAQSFNKIIRDTGYSFETDGYQGINLNIIADHLFRECAAVEMAYQAEPWQTLWVVRADGKLCSLTYLRQVERYAWAVHETCGGTWHDWETKDEWRGTGEFLSVCSIPGEDEDEVWVVVKRKDDNDADIVTVECFYPRFASTDPWMQKFLDCAHEVNGPTTIAGITAADPGVVTATGHGLSEDDEVEMTGILGSSGIMGLNYIRFTAKNVDSNTFELYLGGSSHDTSALGSYASGGVVRKVVTEVSGMDELEGLGPYLLANGVAITSDLTTVSSGVLDTGGIGASVLLAGLPFLAEVELLPLVFLTNAGSSQGKKSKVDNVYVRVHETYGGEIGDKRDNLQDIRNDENEVMAHSLTSGQPTGEPPDLYSGEYQQAFESGYAREQTIIIRQEDPYPLTVLAIHADVDVTE